MEDFKVFTEDDFRQAVEYYNNIIGNNRNIIENFYVSEKQWEEMGHADLSDSVKSCLGIDVFSKECGETITSNDNIIVVEDEDYRRYYFYRGYWSTNNDDCSKKIQLFADECVRLKNNSEQYDLRRREAMERCEEWREKYHNVIGQLKTSIEEISDDIDKLNSDGEWLESGRLQCARYELSKILDRNV